MKDDANPDPCNSIDNFLHFNENINGSNPSINLFYLQTHLPRNALILNIENLI